MIGMFPIVLQLRKQFFIEKNESKRVEVINKIRDEMFRRDVATAHKFIDESGKEMLQYQHQFFLFVLQK
jgi:hypothetical protein